MIGVWDFFLRLLHCLIWSAWGCERKWEKGLPFIYFRGWKEGNDIINDWKVQWLGWKDIPSCKL